MNAGGTWEVRENVNSHFNFSKAAWEGWAGLILGIIGLPALKAAVTYKEFYRRLWLVTEL